jgi:hypothetical protein
LFLQGVPADIYHRLTRTEVEITDAPDLARLLGAQGKRQGQTPRRRQ